MNFWECPNAYFLRQLKDPREATTKHHTSITTGKIHAQVGKGKKKNDVTQKRGRSARPSHNK